MSLLDTLREPEKAPKPVSVHDKGRDELTEMVDQVSVYELACADTGEHPAFMAGQAKFRTCPICGHHDDFVVFADGGWKCFSDSNTTGFDGGNAFHYLQGRGMSKGEAANLIRERVGRPRELPSRDIEPSNGAVTVMAETVDPCPELDFGAGDVLHPQPLKPVVIEGLCRENALMGIYGASKIGKTWLSIELCLAVATGTEWLGHRCQQRRVLFVNPEVDKAECEHRVHEVAKRIPGCDMDAVNANMRYIHARGVKLTLPKLAAKMRYARDVLGEEFGLVLVDSIYMAGLGDECDGAGVGAFLQMLQAIGTEFGCVVAFVHHHSKGGKADVASIDRMSGSGIFARYPDVIADIVELHPPDGAACLPEGVTAFELTMTVRSFAAPPKRRILFDWPRHYIDVEGLTDGWTVSGAARNHKDAGTASGASRSERARDEFAVQEHIILEHMRSIGASRIKLADAAKLLGEKPDTLKKRYERGYAVHTCRFVEGRTAWIYPTAQKVF